MPLGRTHQLFAPHDGHRRRAVADGGTQAVIARIRQETIRDVLAIIEPDVTMTRTGQRGVGQVEVQRAIATGFDHCYSRSSIPICSPIW